MKNRSFSRPMMVFLVLALALIVVGISWGARTFSHFEQLAMNHDSHEELLHSVRVTVFYMIIFGGMVTVGVGILLIEFLHLIRRTARVQREAEVLARKNEEMAALNEKTRTLAHHQRLQTIGTLTASIAHEFNNLLTPIMGYSMMALEKLPPEEALYDDLLEIYNASRKAKSIISRLSDLSRKNTDATFRTASPDALIRRTMDVAAPAKPLKVTVRADLNCWDQQFEVNEIQVSQLLLNLILNGFHAMEDGGGVLTVSSSFDEECIIIRVTDTGCGIAGEIRDRIFEPFFTTKPAGRGTGLGLAIAAQVVEDHRGSIQVASQEGKGAAFIVRIPKL